MANKILIVHISIETDKDLVFKTADKTPELIAEINKKRAILEEQDIEIFAQKDNIIVTENGYYGAFYDNNVP